MISKITNFINQNGGVITTADAAILGISRTTLSNYKKSGKLLRIARGQYILPDSIPDELYIWQKRIYNMIYSHETALFLHGMAERTPLRQTVTLPLKTRLSDSFPGDYKVYYVKPDLLMVGITNVPSKMGNMVKAYDVERTVCDILRSRNRIDDQTVIAATKNYATWKDKNLTKLAEYANIFKVTSVLRKYMVVLV